MRNFVAMSNVNSPFIHRMKMENISQNPLNSYLEILKFYGFRVTESEHIADLCLRIYNRVTVPLSKRNYPLKTFTRSSISIYHLANTLNKYTWEKMSKGRSKGSSDTSSHYRSGKSGDWKKYFTPNIESAFHSKYPTLVSDLGY